ncbi:phosphatase PAP2 family protein [Corynebacterium sp. zg-331]|uniref:phosphatase PAP2 family protein n=1 Tax=unclassified Corynebacterium TaxID=2624378 RepID=UPI00128D7ED0|nr:MULTISPECIES: phosphatase PAP2 family protein [unclassified Corynebacterium]MBC3185144.1 phosphatase PAP2 family protein [Corynebacterium sp. zg-331]MPV51642.1 phosphatase PAP2 family protein [Corynebacterium sp. zg331]
MKYRAGRRALVMASAVAAGVVVPVAPAGAQSTSQELSSAVSAAVELLVENPVMVPEPVLHEGAPVPQPFALDRVARWYRSDVASQGWSYAPVVEAFSALERDHPEVMRRNLDEVVRINNAAAGDPALLERALADDHDDLLMTMSEAWGTELGQAFRQAMAEHRLPKTSQLLSGRLARGGGLASSTAVEKYWFGYDRPFVVAPDRITRYHREGGDDEYSTTPSFPSGHTNRATWKSAVMAALLPELGAQVLARGSEVGYHRLVMGVHYPLDVMGGRMVGLAAAADRLNDPEFHTLIREAGIELRAELEWRCGTSVSECASRGRRYLSPDQAQEVFTQRLNYGFERVGEPGAPMIVPQGAEALLEARFPELAAWQRAQVLQLTAQDSGYPLDKGGPAGSWQRLNLVAAWNAHPVVNADGTVTLG